MVAAFIVIPLLLAAAFVWGIAWSWQRSGAAPRATVRAAAFAALGATGWMSATWIAAQSGLLRRWDHVPPPFGLLVLAIVLLAFLLAFTTPGRRLAQFVPLWALVAVQAFRLPLELAMHQLSDRGIMPPQMTYTGRNFDILTGVSAVIVAVVAARGRGRVLVTAWNVIGLALLMNVVTCGCSLADAWFPAASVARSSGSEGRPSVTAQLRKQDIACNGPPEVAGS